MNELCTFSVTATARVLRSGEVSSTELVKAHIERIEAVNRELNAVVATSFDTALEQAARADAAYQHGRPNGILHGIPVTIKDCFDTAGLVTTGGTQGRANYIPQRDAVAVSRLKNNGAIVLGKTNCPEFSLAYETDNLVYGRTNNPYSKKSSFRVAAVAAKGPLSQPAAHRWASPAMAPAVFACLRTVNGIAGIKPTTGRVPTGGYWPPLPSVLTATNAVGLMARRVADLRFVLPLLTGIDGEDPFTVPMPAPDPDEVDLTGLRVAVHTDNGAVPADVDTGTTVKRVAEMLADAGCIVEERRPPGLADVPELFMDMYSIDGGDNIRKHLEMAGTTELHPMLAGLLRMISSRKISGADAARTIRRLQDFQSGMLVFMQEFDAILCPVVAFSAFSHGETFNHMPAFSYAYAYNFTGWPCLAVRAGASS